MFIDKLEHENLVPPELAVKLGNFCTVQHIEICEEISEEYCRKYPDRLKATTKGDFFFDLACLMSTIWNAGRVQGIREERKKRNIS